MQKGSGDGQAHYDQHYASHLWALGHAGRAVVGEESPGVVKILAQKR